MRLMFSFDSPFLRYGFPSSLYSFASLHGYQTKILVTFHVLLSFKRDRLVYLNAWSVQLAEPLKKRCVKRDELSSLKNSRPSKLAVSPCLILVGQMLRFQLLSQRHACLLL